MAAVLRGSRQQGWRCSPFVPASGIEGESLPRGPCCSSIHQERQVLHLPTRHQLSPWVVPPIPQHMLVSGERIALRYCFVKGLGAGNSGSGRDWPARRGGNAGEDERPRRAGPARWSVGRSSSPALRDGPADRRSPPGPACSRARQVRGVASASERSQSSARAAQATVRDGVGWL